MDTAYKTALQALVAQHKDDIKDGFKGAYSKMGDTPEYHQHISNVTGALSGLCHLGGVDISQIPLGSSIEEASGYYQRIVDFLTEGGHI